MEELFRIWRRIPRFIFGASTLVACLAIVVGRERTIESLNGLAEIQINQISGIVSGAVLVVGIVALGSTGIFLFDILITGVGILIRRVTRFNALLSFFRQLDLEDLTLSLGCISKRIFTSSRTQIISYFQLKSTANPEKDVDSNEVGEFYKQVNKHMLDLANEEVLCPFGYYSSQPMDQQKLDGIELDIKDYYYMLIFLFSLSVLAFRFNWSMVATSSLMTLLGVATVFSMPMIRNKKRMLAHFYLYAYMEAFTIHVGQDAIPVDEG